MKDHDEDGENRLGHRDNRCSGASSCVGVDVRLGDVTEGSIVRDSMHGVYSVIHLAALLHFANPPLALKEKYERINDGGQ